ncbi:MAG TPA: bis(5'-nucleosyl)-tetraphosphatase (symmetrical) YqeK [Virgibacillus sp.]|nr:bis(5'-nucleosyl)-tetraphosphatase (symmetrical) YqeK [Virgibacillus sp.]
MKINEATAYVKPHLTKERFDHTLRVAEEAVALARLYHVDEKKAELAALFHDYAKYRPLKEMERIIRVSQLPKDLLNYHHELWHGPVGALLIEYEYGITDKEIQSAIHSHTTGKAHMTKLDLIIFLADYIEPCRSFPGLEEVREAAKSDLYYASYLVSRNTIHYLSSKNRLIYPDAFYAYNDLVKYATQ